MIALGIYLLVGFLVCLFVISDRKRTDRAGDSTLLMPFDPVWPIVLLWPIFLLIAYIDDRHPDVKRGTPHPPVEHIGSTAIVVVALRPLGRIQIGSVQYDARATSEFVPEGSIVRVIGKSMSELVVEVMPNKASEPTPTSVRSLASQERASRSCRSRQDVEDLLISGFEKAAS